MACDRRSLAVSCAVSLALLGCGGEDLSAPTTGQIVATTSTTGAEPDPDGFTLSLDGLQAVAIDANGSHSFTVMEGGHTLDLGGLAPNCSVEAGTRRAVPVAAGDTVAVSFDVVCGATTGGLHVVTTSSGTPADPDGYSLIVDQGQPQAIGANADVSLTGLAAGNHAVELSGVAGNCSVSGDNPVTVAVSAGQVTQLAFTVACAPEAVGWTPMTSNTRADLEDLWGSSAADVFAVGESGTGGDDVASVILHYDGTAWSRQLRQANLRLRSVWGSGPADVFAVGFDFLVPDAKVLHYDGAAWREMPGLTAEFEELTLESVWGAAATDVFAVGSAFDGVFHLSLIFHYDGSAWQRMFVDGPVAPALLDVWGSSGTDVYAVGRDDEADPSQAVVMHFDGATWSPVLQEEALSLSSVWGSSATDVFVCGFEVHDDGNGGVRSVGTVRHFDGTAWSRVTLPTSRILREIWGTSATDVFVVGDGVVLHYDGAVWSETRPTSSLLLGVWGSAPTDVFVAGTRGVILHGTP